MTNLDRMSTNETIRITFKSDQSENQITGELAANLSKLSNSYKKKRYGTAQYSKLAHQPAFLVKAFNVNGVGALRSQTVLYFPVNNIVLHR